MRSPAIYSSYKEKASLSGHEVHMYAFLGLPIGVRQSLEKLVPPSMHEVHSDILLGSTS